MASDHARWFAGEVQPHEALLRNYLRSSFRGIRDVDDVVQESYVRIWKARARQPIDSAKALLFTVARRLALNALRKSRNAPLVQMADLSGLPVPDDGPNGAEAVCDQERIELLAEALSSLPTRCREIVVLRRLKGIPQKEVSLHLGVSERTVERQTRLGLQRCMAHLRRLGVLDLYSG